METLRALIAQERRCMMRPRAFFIAWCGVPMLTHEGFPVPILNIKKNIDLELPHLTPENPGSRWPGTTLGTLHEGYTLSSEELKKLRKICSHFDTLIQQDQTQFLMTELHYILFQCRSLEKRLLSVPLSLRNGKFDNAPFPKKHLNWINHIHSQFDAERLDDYLPSVQQKGHREGHYRANHIESTLIMQLPDEQPDYIDAFIQEVNAELPGRYVWFTPQSRHITVRALAFKNG